MPTGHRCELCGKLFTAPSRLRAHQNNKNPCVVQHVDDVDVNNPLRCVYCNKVYADRTCLHRHKKICKKRDDNINPEIIDKIEKQDDKIDKLTEALTRLLDRLLDGNDVVRDGTMVNNGTINVNNNNITLNNYYQPTYPQISFDDIKDCKGLHRLIMQETYFNPKLPQNHVVYPINRNAQNRCMTAYDGGWRKLTGSLVDDALRTMSDTAYKIGGVILRDNEQLIREQYEAAGRPVEFKTRIANFKAREEMLDLDEIFAMAVEFSPMMKKPNV